MKYIRGKKRLIPLSYRSYICGFCDRKRTGPFRIVDGYKSCEKCNRAYDYVPSKEEKMMWAREIGIKCPVCKGEGVLK